MSSIYPSFEDETFQPAVEVDAEGISANLVQLDQMANKSKVSPLSSMIDSRTMLEIVSEDFDEATAPKVQWFDPAEGLTTVKTLLKAVAIASEGLEYADETIEDLKDLQKALQSAEQAGTRFHLLVDA